MIRSSKVYSNKWVHKTNCSSRKFEANSHQTQFRRSWNHFEQTLTLFCLQFHFRPKKNPPRPMIAIVQVDGSQTKSDYNPNLIYHRILSDIDLCVGGDACPWLSKFRTKLNPRVRTVLTLTPSAIVMLEIAGLRPYIQPLFVPSPIPLTLVLVLRLNIPKLSK